MKLFNPAPPAFTLDFVAQRQRPSLLGWLLLLAAVLASAAVVLEYFDVQERLDEAQQQLARAQRLEERANGLQRARKQERVPEADLRRAAQIAARLQEPWPQLVPQLEAAGNEDIALLSLDADAGKAQINLAGEARSLEAVFDYAKRIGKQPGFASVQVQNYEFHKVGSQDLVQFKLSARWRSEA
ncbi:PilN domain-containing protein [Uliginosibacterium sp. H3]|uniref:PilN domain-containing protein n=1 Tax=Uliginosibacterium silvisoli TaxID=3114758 RepID=A0ABU6K6A0_9RHOO|nr:PilN domain-containing protein [Uliginosibacterium sp. H3]